MREQGIEDFGHADENAKVHIFLIVGLLVVVILLDLVLLGKHVFAYRSDGGARLFLCHRGYGEVLTISSIFVWIPDREKLALK